MDLDEKLVSKIAQEVESDWQMTGLSGGIYEEYATEILKRWLKKMDELSTQPSQD